MPITPPNYTLPAGVEAMLGYVSFVADADGPSDDAFILWEELCDAAPGVSVDVIRAEVERAFDGVRTLEWSDAGLWVRA